MYVKRQGGDLYISAKLDERTDITYWFRRCMFNELHVYRVGITRNRAALPSTQPEAEPAVLLQLDVQRQHRAFRHPGCGWCGATTNTGGNARRARHAARGYTLLADGNRIEGDTTLWAIG